MHIRPIKTEKTLKEAARNHYTFSVELAATKPQIKKAVEKLFSVKVDRVQTAVLPGKIYRAGKKGLTRRKPEWKKAIVHVADGKKIELFGPSAETK